MRRAHFLILAALVLGLAAPAAAQTGRIQGIVKDINGRPIKGATITARHADSSSRELTSTSDDKGRFVFLGLRTATTWRFVAAAPGFYSMEGEAPVRSQFGEPVQFALRPDPGPLPGALVKDIQQQLTAAHALRDQGRFDQALLAYQSIQSKNPKLTTLSLVIAELYREQAGRESAPAPRLSLLEKAAAAYADVLKDDEANERAKTEMAAVAASIQDLKKN